MAVALDGSVSLWSVISQGIIWLVVLTAVNGVLILRMSRHLRFRETRYLVALYVAFLSAFIGYLVQVATYFGAMLIPVLRYLQGARDIVFPLALALCIRKVYKEEWNKVLVASGLVLVGDILLVILAAIAFWIF
ncbi:MAG: hypothetical protein ABIH41_06860 [Nanoarchaeota archaeon]